MDKTLQKEIQPPAKDRYLIDDGKYQEKETGEVRERVFFAWYPVYLGLPDLIPLPGCKFTWLRKVKITEKQVMFRGTEFDDGWSYQFYWGKWKEKWVIIRLEKI